MDVVENRRSVDNSPGAAETAREVCQRQEFPAEFNESETGLLIHIHSRLISYIYSAPYFVT